MKINSKDLRSTMEEKSKEDKLREISIATRASQLMIQQLMQNIKAMSDDLTKAFNQIYDMQYRLLALQKHLDVDVESLNAIANEMRLRHFEEAAAKADLNEGLETADVATEDSTVIITSVAKDESGEDHGIFRSRIKLSETGVPDLISALTGKRVGDKAVVKLNGLDHEITLLSIKRSKASSSTTTTTTEQQQQQQEQAQTTH